MGFPLCVHQRRDVGGNGVTECLQIVTALEQRDDPATGKTVGDIHDLLRRPDEIRFRKIDVAAAA